MKEINKSSEKLATFQKPEAGDPELLGAIFYLISEIPPSLKPLFSVYIVFYNINIISCQVNVSVHNILDC